MDNQEQPLIDAARIDPKTHPVIFQEFEYTAFQQLQKTRPSVLHRHDWVYRLDRALGEVYIVSNTEMIATHLSPGRYCPRCKRVQYLAEDVAKRHTDEHWTQLDLIALGFK